MKGTSFLHAGMSIARVDIAPGIPGLEIEHPLATARVSLHGAQILAWTPAGHEPVLYLSPQSAYCEGKAIRGGVPVCWPWFGPHPDNRILPSHGLARTRSWQLEEEGVDDRGVRLVFVLTDSEETRRLWPRAFRLEMEMHIGRELKLALHMRNTHSEPVQITAALHTYLAVRDIRAVTITGLEGAEFLDTTVSPPEVRRQEGDIRFTGEIDRNYQSSGVVRIDDGARVLTVHGEGSNCAVVWNPWIAKAAALADLPDDDYLRFVCVETANAWQDTVTIPPGGSHTLATTIRVD